MFIGHYGVALAAKRIEPKISLGVFFLAALLPDLVWPLFLLAGIEEVAIFPGITQVTPLDFVYYPYSHSLLSALLASVAAYGAGYALWHSGRAAKLMAALVLSHWILDFITHTRDLPLIFGRRFIKAGLGLWDHLAASVALESAIFAAGLFLYVRTIKPKDKTGKFALWALTAFLLVTWLGSIFGPPPPNATVIALSALLLWLLIPWAIWIDRHRAAGV